MVTDVASLIGAGLSLPTVGPMFVYVGMVVLCAVLPFVLTFAADAGAAMLRRGRSALPVLLTAAVLALVVAATGFLVMQLGLSFGGTTPVTSARVAEVAQRLLLVCVPIAVLTLLVRLSIAGLRAKAHARRNGEAAETDPGQLARLLEFVC